MWFAASSRNDRQTPSWNLRSAWLRWKATARDLERGGDVLVLDTSFLIEYEREIAGRRIGLARNFLRGFPRERPATSIIAVGEFAEGFADRRQLEVFLANFAVLQLSREIAWRMATLQGHVAQRLGENDAWIAATALAYSATLVGREASFRRVPRLKYEEF